MNATTLPAALPIAADPTILDRLFPIRRGDACYQRAVKSLLSRSNRKTTPGAVRLGFHTFGAPSRREPKPLEGQEPRRRRSPREVTPAGADD